MRGVVFIGDRELAYESFPDPSPGPDDVVIEIKASGMCGSDLHSYRRPKDDAPSLIAGHEPAGLVAAVGASVKETMAREGQRVMVHHYSGCGRCGQCRSGWPQLCRIQSPRIYGVNAHGAHAPYLQVPAHTLLPLDDSLSFRVGAAISCGAGTAWGAFQRLRVSGHETIAVFGQGPVGLSATLLASSMGARVLAIDIEPARLKKALEFGADRVINPLERAAVHAIREATSGEGATMALETSGSAVAAQDALNCVKTWGTVCYVGLGAEVRFDVRQMLPSQITIMTSWSMSIAGQMDCADYIVERGLNLDKLFTDEWTLDEAETAYRHFDMQNSGKGVLDR